MNVDILIAVSVFIVMVSLLLYLTLGYISQLPTISKVSEYREKAKDIFEKVFESEGSPTDWEREGTPAEIGVEKRLYRIPIIVEDKSGKNRINEVVRVSLTFDEECENRTWNSTVRIFDESLNEVPFKFVFQSFCNSNYISSATLVFKVNVSANSKRRLFVYYSNDESIATPNYTWDLVLYLPFDEGNGNYAYDYSGYNHTGTLYNGSVICNNGDCPRWVNGRFGYGIDLDGVNDFVQVPGSFVWGKYLTDSFTVSFFAKPKTLVTGYAENRTRIFDNYGLGVGSDTSAYFTCYYAGNSKRFQFGTRSTDTGEGIWPFPPSNTATELNKWYYVVWVWNYTHSMIYQDGQLIGGPFADTRGGKELNFTGLLLGKRGSEFGNVTVDEVKIWSRALSKDEIVSHNATPLVVKVFPKQQLGLISPSKLSALRSIGYTQSKDILGEDYEFRIEVNPVED